MTSTWLANDGIGDAFRQAAVLRQHYGANPVNIECESELAAEAWRTIRYIEKVTVVEKGRWLARSVEYRASMGCPEALAELGRLWDMGPLRLSPRDFRVPVVEAHPLVVQYQTTSHKRRFFDVANYPLSYPRTLVGTEAQAGSFSDLQDLRQEPLEIAVGAVVSPGCEQVVGVESWACLLGALLGKRVVMEISYRAAKVLAPNWQRMFPTMTFRLTTQEP